MSELLARFPERSLAIALLRRGTILWLLAKLIVVSLSAAGTGRVSVGLLPPTSVALALVVGGLGYLDARRRNEHRFMANLGVSPAAIVLLSTTPALLAECVLGVSGLR